MRGVRRGKDGKFRNKPKVIRTPFTKKLVKRRLSRAYDLLRESVVRGASFYVATQACRR